MGVEKKKMQSRLNEPIFLNGIHIFLVSVHSRQNIRFYLREEKKRNQNENNNDDIISHTPKTTARSKTYLKGSLNSPC